MVTTTTTGPVVEERHVVHDDSSSSSMLALLIVAAVVVIGLLLFAMRAFPFNAAGGASRINVDLPNVTTPVNPTPDVDVNNNVNPTAPTQNY